ncbi:hypothetical protein JCM16814_15980 [Desulfobaculum senezii]|jgi:uncharacterized protein HemY
MTILTGILMLFILVLVYGSRNVFLAVVVFTGGVGAGSILLIGVGRLFLEFAGTAGETNFLSITLCAALVLLLAASGIGFLRRLLRW